MRRHLSKLFGGGFFRSGESELNTGGQLPLQPPQRRGMHAGRHGEHPLRVQILPESVPQKLHAHPARTSELIFMFNQTA